MNSIFNSIDRNKKEKQCTKSFSPQYERGNGDSILMLFSSVTNTNTISIIVLRHCTLLPPRIPLLLQGFLTLSLNTFANIPLRLTLLMTSGRSVDLKLIHFLFICTHAHPVLYAVLVCLN